MISYGYMEKHKHCKNIIKHTLKIVSGSLIALIRLILFVLYFDFLCVFR